MMRARMCACACERVGGLGLCGVGWSGRAARAGVVGCWLLVQRLNVGGAVRSWVLGCRELMQRESGLDGNWGAKREGVPARASRSEATASR